MKSIEYQGSNLGLALDSGIMECYEILLCWFAIVGVFYYYYEDYLSSHNIELYNDNSV